MKIYVDDMRIAPVGWVRFTSAENLIEALPTLPTPIEDVSFDHDLGEPTTHKSGYDLVKYLVNEEPNFFDTVNTVAVHSSNTVGRKNMLTYLTNAQTHGIINSDMKIIL